jgi:hypothetical protein
MPFLYCMELFYITFHEISVQVGLLKRKRMNFDENLFPINHKYSIRAAHHSCAAVATIYFTMYSCTKCLSEMYYCTYGWGKSQTLKLLAFHEYLSSLCFFFLLAYKASLVLYAKRRKKTKNDSIQEKQTVTTSEGSVTFSIHVQIQASFPHTI